MKKLIRCKACGYIMLEGKLKDKCPACGVPRDMFEPYTDPMAESRRRILDFHLHPIAVHFPTSFAVAVLVFSVAIFFFSGPIEELLISTTKVMALFLPLLVLIAFLVGLVDGKIRFRRLVHSHILKTKMLWGSLFFVIAIAFALVVWLGGFGSVVLTSIAAVLAAAAVGCSVVLALLGMQILNSAFPG
jgi:O-antigen/teichoic acid export membrane protein/rubredoxin